MKFGEIFSIIMLPIIFWGCKKNSINQIVGHKTSVESEIYKQLEQTPFQSLTKKNFTTINSAHKEMLKEIDVNSIKYKISIENEKIIVIETCDRNFSTVEGFSVQTKIKKIFNQYKQNILVEPGVYIFIQLEDGWRAVISYDISNFSVDDMDLNSTIKMFIKVDSSLTNCMALNDWIEFIK